MVHKTRSSRKSCPVMDVSPLRNTLPIAANKYELSSSPRIGYALEVPTRPVGSSANSSNAWYFNDMVKNNRQQFNSLHFC
ncbi:uncharacterized protein LOC133327517 [Musca vetustissima]|uniref:uncharacterized protein LOC133327517 n=1 Tax=Musca vetustissima TaxID=27455 RepID=UPI002AB7D07E|nr:uncharacterized protein LOC133327517 [Musca vetustissima]